MELEHTKIIDGTWGNYIQAEMMTQGWGRERILINGFFGSQPYAVTEEYLGAYNHNLCQFVMQEFFKENGFEVVFEGAAEDDDCGPSAVIFENVEYDYDKTFRAYTNAAIGYHHSEHQKMLVMVKRHEDNSFYYRIFSSSAQTDLLKKWKEYSRKKNFYRNKKINAVAKFLDLRDVSWDDVILPEGMKNLLKTMTMGAINKSSLYLKNKLSLKRGILMSGKPGTGKTSVIKVIAKESPITVIYAQPSHLMGAKDVRQVCSMAKDLAPCILFIEDIDWIAEDRNTGEAGRVIELMNQLDGLEEFTNVLTIATTNDVEKIETAIKNRPGRFDRVITIENPNEECRMQMFKLFCKNWKTDGVNWEQAIKFTDGLSGAHMADLCKTAAICALEDGSLDEEGLVIIQQKHFDGAIREVKDKDYSTYMQVKSTGKKKKMGFFPDDDDD